MSMELWRCQRVFGRARAARACHRGRACAGTPRTGPAIHRQALTDFARGAPLPAGAPTRSGGLPAGVASLLPDARCSWDTLCGAAAATGYPLGKGARLTRRAPRRGDRCMGFRSPEVGRSASRSGSSAWIGRPAAGGVTQPELREVRLASGRAGFPTSRPASARCGSPAEQGGRDGGVSARKAEDPTPAGVRRDSELAASRERGPAGSRATRRQGGGTTDHGSSVLRSSRCAHG
jgi:hypothetical protein